MRARARVAGGVCCTFTSIMGIIILVSSPPCAPCIAEPVDIPTRAPGVDQVVRVWLQSVVSRLLDSEYPFLQKELFLHLDEDGVCSRGEGCKCDIYGNGTMVACDAAGNASTACMYGAIMYVVTLAMSAGCCIMGKTKKATGVGGPM